MSRWLQFRAELPHMVTLAGPVVLAELGWMAMGVVDTIMIGRLGPEAIGAVGIGNILFNCIGIMTIGFLLGMDTLISQAFGRGDQADCDHSLRQGLWLGSIVGPALLLIIWAVAPTLRWWGLHPDVLALAIPFLDALSWSVLPLTAYAAFRRYLQSIGLVRPVMIALVSANAINWLGNWMLIYGNLGAPAMGIAGSGWSTCIARVYQAAFLGVIIAMRKGVLRWDPPDWQRIGTLFRLGLPAAGHIFLEIAVFGAATALAGQFPPVALAAHEITLNNAALTYMVPLGISSAAAIRVGHAIGRGDRAGARLAGWTAIVMGASFMATTAIVMLTLPRQILRVYSPDQAVIDFGVPLLFCAAAFQLFDGIQAVTTGALRGIGDTQTPFTANMIGYWVLGLPAGVVLCFWRGWGVAGLWVGLTIGLMVVALVLVRRWRRAMAPTTVEAP